jgi:hypothetical protein
MLCANNTRKKKQEIKEDLFTTGHLKNALCISNWGRSSVSNQNCAKPLMQADR